MAPYLKILGTEWAFFVLDVHKMLLSPSLTISEEVAALLSNLYQVRNTFIHIEARFHGVKYLTSAKPASPRKRVLSISATSSQCLMACAWSASSEEP